MDTVLSLLIIIITSAAVIALSYFAARQLIVVIGEDRRIIPFEDRSLIDLCDCEAGVGKKERYYHAVNRRYRQFLEREQ